MARSYLKGSLLVLISFAIVSCAMYKAQTGQTSFGAFEPYKFQKGQYQGKVDNFLVILDASESMADPYNGVPKLDTALESISRMNQTIPQDLKINGALRTFGQGPCLPAGDTSRIYGLTAYSAAGLEGALKTVKCTGGNTPMELGFEAASEDLKSAQGKIALIVVSDGIVLDNAPMTAARKMKEMYGDRLCIYTILVGNHPGGKAVMEGIAKLSGCGFSVNADNIFSSNAMADFVEKVFLSKAAPAKPLDSDGDGVIDDLDRCPGTPKGVKVDAKGCPLDTDGDGVPDYLDKCPDTPKGVKVDSVGCPLDTDGDGVPDYLDKCPGTPVGATVDKRGCWVIKGVQFDTAKWDIKPQAYPSLDEVVTILKKNPSLKLEIQGHTDNRGAPKYNQSLSEKRANAVMEYFVGKGVEQSRLSAKGYGLTKPAASNDSAAGRAQNRRVELKPIL